MHAQHEGAVRPDAQPWTAPPVLGNFEVADAAITVMVASGRAATHATWLSWMAWQPDIEIAGGPVTDAARLADAVDRHRPQVLLLDATMLACLGRSELQGLARNPDLRVLLVAEQAGRADVDAVLRHHFHGVLSATSPTHLCLKAIRAVSAGELWLSRRLMAEFLSEAAWPMVPEQVLAPTGTGSVPASKALTDRERQVVARLHQGRSNKEIARELGIVEDTVKKHLKSVYTKLGVRRRAMVILQASAGA